MNIQFRKGGFDDLKQLKKLALKSWQQFQPQLREKNWKILLDSLNDDKTYNDLLGNSTCFICTTNAGEIIGMAFLVCSGNPTDIYHKDWCYIRFLSVDPDFSDRGIGKKLTQICIDTAKLNNEKTIALHTSVMMKKARHIYETLGFIILKEIAPRLGKKYWLYKLEL